MGFFSCAALRALQRWPDVAIPAGFMQDIIDAMSQEERVRLALLLSLDLRNRVMEVFPDEITSIYRCADMLSVSASAFVLFNLPCPSQMQESGRKFTYACHRIAGQR